MKLKVDPFYLDIGQRIRKARNRAGLRQDQLGELIGLSRTSIVNIEAGKQRLLVNQLFDIALHLRATFLSLVPHHAPPPTNGENWMDDPELGQMLLDSFREAVARLRNKRRKR